MIDRLELIGALSRRIFASAPAGALYKHFGITAEAVVEAVKARL